MRAGSGERGVVLAVWKYESMLECRVASQHRTILSDLLRVTAWKLPTVPVHITDRLAYPDGLDDLG